MLRGKARMTVFGLGDNIDTFEVGPGEIVFILSAYFHYIENLSDSEDMQFAIFFNNERSHNIGLSGGLRCLFK
jgi:oxalate decarboxylase/phosphoglucose isomerase-like protein (cupin superfamily)